MSSTSSVEIVRCVKWGIFSVFVRSLVVRCFGAVSVAWTMLSLVHFVQCTSARSSISSVATIAISSSANFFLQFGQGKRVRSVETTRSRSVKSMRNGKQKSVFTIDFLRLRCNVYFPDNATVSRCKLRFFPSAFKSSKTPGENCWPLNATRTGQSICPFLTPSS